MLHPLTAHSIRYDGLMAALAGQTVRAVSLRLMEKLPRLWDLSYREMTGRTPEILEVRLDAITYRLDEGTRSQRGADELVVVAYGFSRPTGARRDSSRMQEFFRGGLTDELRRRLESEGGPLGIDLFPNRPEETAARREAWSSRGVSFREMKTWCAENPGAFFFARPIYLNDGRAHRALEYGVLRGARDLWVERFPNAEDS